MLGTTWQWAQKQINFMRFTVSTPPKVTAERIKSEFTTEIKQKKKVEIWGSGNVKREFLNVEDLADAIKFCLSRKIKYPYLNIGSGEHISIKKLALLIKKITKFKGGIYFNKNYPDGVKLRKLDNKKIIKLGWKSKISLKKGLVKYYNYFEKNVFEKN